MVPREKLQIFAAQGARPIAGERQSVGLQPGELVHQHAGRTEPVGPRRQLLDLDEVQVEYREHELVECPVVVVTDDVVDDACRLRGTERVPLEQAVAPGLEPRRHVLPCGAHVGDEPVHLRRQRLAVAIRALRQVAQAWLELLEQFTRAGQVHLERVQAKVIPARQHLEVRALDERHVHPDFFALANAIEAAEPLFEQRRIEWQVEQHQVVRELEVAPLAADLGADQQACAVGIGEPGRAAIALDQRQPLVEGRHRHGGAVAKRRLDGKRLALRPADQQHLGRRQFLQQADQPLDPRVVLERDPGVRVRSCFDVGGPLVGECPVAGRAVDRQRMQVRDARGKTGDGGAGVPEHHASRAVLIEQAFNPLTPRAVAAGVEGLCQRRGRFAEHGCEVAALVARERRTVLQARREARHVLVVRALAAELFEVVEAIGVEQPQAGEVARHTQLLRCGREQQQPL